MRRSCNGLPIAGEPSGTLASTNVAPASRSVNKWTSDWAGISRSICARIKSVTDTVWSMPSNLKIASFFGLLMRAIVRATLNFFFAIWQIIRLSSSSPVTAIANSARPIPASSINNESVASPR